jgi:hypothetical protein
MEELRIPKIPVSIRCYAVTEEVFGGQIFLDVMSSAGYTTSQVLEFFNSSQLFFPMKLDSGQSVLIQKQSLFRVDVPELFHEYESEVSWALNSKLQAGLHFTSGHNLRGDIIVDMPKDHARAQDVLNSGRTFIPLLLETTLSLINIHHLSRVEEA